MSETPKPMPKWREDFPFETEADEHITRRDFTRFLLLVSAGLAVGNGWVLSRALTHSAPKYSPTDIAAADELAPGQWRVFKYPDEKTPAILIRRLNGELVAFQQKCTHLACPVAYSRDHEGRGEALTCHCHNGSFDINSGAGVSGPPRELRPLPQVKLEIRDGRVYAVGLA